MNATLTAFSLPSASQLVGGAVQRLTELDVHECCSLVGSQGPDVQLVHRLDVLQLQQVLSNPRRVQVPGSA